MKIVWLDPGKRTGVCFGETIRGKTASQSLSETIRVFEIECDDEDAGAWALIELIGMLEPDVVGIETFRLFPGMEHSPDLDGTKPMRLEAKLDFMFWLTRLDAIDLNRESAIPKVVKQMPGERTVITAANLRKWGCWRTKSQGGGKDAMAAAQHWVVYARKLAKEARKGS